METFRTFPNATDAREYRHKHGTGGWIFEPETGHESILFPPTMTPTAIFNHCFTKGRNGQLLGCQ